MKTVAKDTKSGIFKTKQTVILEDINLICLTLLLKPHVRLRHRYLNTFLSFLCAQNKECGTYGGNV